MAENSNKRYKQIIAEIPTRQEHLSKYAPFFSIFESMKNGKYKEYSSTTLVLSTMSFMLYEGNLKDKGLLFVEMQEFLAKFIFHHYKKSMTEKESMEFTKDILEKLSNKGLKFSYEYFNPVKDSNYIEYVQYISITPDRKTGTHKYSLTNAGIEFLLNTKEFGDESKISIYLLLLQKQLKNNNLEDVLNKLVSINAEIKKQIEEKENLIDWLVYAPNDRFEEYLDYKSRAIITLRDEEQMFMSTKQQVLKYEENYLDNLSNKEKIKVKNAPILLEKINRELEKNIINHQTLLHSIVGLSEEIPKIRADRARRLFKSSFNFEHHGNEILKLDNIENLRYLIEPLLKPKQLKKFNINKIGDMFNYKAKAINNDKKEVHEKEYIGEVYTIEDETEDRLKCNYLFYMREMLGLLKNNLSMDLNEYVSTLVDKYNEEIITNRDFISFVYGLIPYKKDNARFLFNNLDENENLTGIHRAYLEVLNNIEELEEFKDLELVCKPLKSDYVELDGVLKIRNMSIEVLKND